MQIFDRLYQLDHQSAPWHTFRYTIRSEDRCLYQVRRTGFRKYRQFEDVNGKILFYIGVTTIKSVDDEKILATMKIDGKTVETMIGNFMINDMDICRRSYILKINENIVAEVKRNRSVTRDQYIIQMKNINEQYQTFIFALFVLIDSVLETMQSPTMHPYLMYGHAPLQASNVHDNIGCCSSEM